MLKLVYGCLAFSVVALVVLFVSAGGRQHYFHGSTKAMNDAIVNPAAVLAADKHGAVTQTGNGRITGYIRSGDGSSSVEQSWSESFDRFAEGPDNPYGAGSIDAHAWCGGTCPNAIVNIRGLYSVHPAKDAGLASALNDLALKPDLLLQLTTLSEAFVSVAPEGSATPRLTEINGRKPTSLPVLAPSAIQSAHSRMVVGSAIAGTGKITTLARESGSWRVTGGSFTESSLKNACISGDGEWVGTVSDRVSMRRFSGGPAYVVGPPVSSGTCTVSADGITALYTTVADPNILEAARWAPGGRQLWRQQIGAFKPLSQASSPTLVAFAPDGTLRVVDAVSGKRQPDQHLAHEPFVGTDGSVVTTKRDGTPHWLYPQASGR